MTHDQSEFAEGFLDLFQRDRRRSMEIVRPQAGEDPPWLDRGVIVRVLPDRRMAWRPDGSQTELIALPESLLRVW